MTGKLMDAFNTAAGKQLAKQQLELLINSKALKVLEVNWDEKAAYVSFDVNVMKGRIIGKAWVMGSMFNALKEIGGLDECGGADEKGGGGEAGDEAGEEGQEGEKEAGADGERGVGAGEPGHNASDTAEGGGEGEGDDKGGST